MTIANMTASKSRIKSGDPRAAAAHAGWHDALQGRPLNPQFADHANRSIASTYMQWRYRAVEVKTVLGHTPTWRTINCVPPRIYQAFRQAAALEHARGNPSCVPITKLPDDPHLEFA